MMLYRTVKRTFDIISSGAALVLALPIMVGAAIGIEISDPGPVFYFAERTTKNDRRFKMLKFRSMRIDADADEASLRPDEDRIFPFGHFIRRTKIDELPQLLNVLIGDMSVVGPRPAAVDQLSITRGGDNQVVSTVKAGLTSPAALYDYLYGDSICDESEYMEKVVPTRLALDRLYIEKQSISYDAMMILQTFRCIFGVLISSIPTDILDDLTKATEDTNNLGEVDS